MNHAESDTIVKLRRIGEKSSRTIKVINPNVQKENLISRGVISQSDNEMDIRAAAATRAAVEKARVCKLPIAGYDTNTKKAFVELPDGGKVYIE